MTAARPRPFRTAEILAVGTELLTPYRSDSNSLFITARLNELGVEVRAKAIVGDDPADLRAMLEQARGRVDLVVLTGGLGPTDDDVTRPVAASTLGLALEEDPAIVEWLERRFASRGYKMSPNNRRQAQVPAGAMTLENQRGTAPGLWIDQGDRGVLLLPGPPREMQPMLEAFIRDVLAARTSGRRLYRRVLRIAGWGESSVDHAVQPVYSRWTGLDPPIFTTILAAPGQVELHLTTAGEDAATAGARLDRAVAELTPILRPGLFSTDGRSLEEVVGDLLRERRMTIAAGESCTGGLISSRLTDVPGSSDYVLASVVAYSNRAKTELLGVTPETIEAGGAVSEAVAVAMADGARDRGGADVGVGVTGIAGPGGATPSKPVGMVCIAVTIADGRRVVRTFQFPGERAVVKQQAAQAALEMLRRALGGEA
jgi:nicotinamide-nucleotide amidase